MGPQIRNPSWGPTTRPKSPQAQSDHRREEIPVNPFTAFCRQVAKEQMSVVIFVGCILLLAIICFFAPMTVPVLNLTLPQPRLASALLVFAVLIISFGYFAFWRGQRPSSATVGESASLSAPLSDQSTLLVAPQIFEDPPKVRVLVSGDGEGMSFWKLDGAGELRSWLDVVNFTAAPVKIDRIIGDITVCNVTIGKLGSLERETIRPWTGARVYLHADLSAQAIKNIEFQLQHTTEPTGGLILTVYAVVDGAEVELRPRLATGNVRFVNFPRKAAS